MASRMLASSSTTMTRAGVFMQPVSRRHVSGRYQRRYSRDTPMHANRPPLLVRRSNVRLPLLPLLAAASPALAAAPPVHVLPMWMQGNHPAVAVSLNGSAEPLRFVVDSAAGVTLVDGRVARRHGLEDPRSATTHAQGASAQSAPLQRMHTTSWRIGGWQLRVSGVQADLSNLQKDDD